MPYEAGKIFLGIDRGATVKLLMAEGAKHIGELQAWDMKMGKKSGRINSSRRNWGPVLTTGGGLVFLGGTNDRYFRAFDAKQNQSTSGGYA